VTTPRRRFVGRGRRWASFAFHAGVIPTPRRHPRRENDADDDDDDDDGDDDGVGTTRGKAPTR
jgi:hypothetical protein